jgi:hypothetical protein
VDRGRHPAASAGYLENSERKDYDSRPEAERANHVYRSVEIVRDWIMSEWSAGDDKITAITRTIIDPSVNPLLRRESDSGGGVT